MYSQQAHNNHAGMTSQVLASRDHYMKAADKLRADYERVLDENRYLKELLSEAGMRLGGYSGEYFKQVQALREQIEDATR